MLLEAQMTHLCPMQLSFGAAELPRQLCESVTLRGGDKVLVTIIIANYYEAIRTLWFDTTPSSSSLRQPACT